MNQRDARRLAIREVATVARALDPNRLATDPADRRRVARALTDLAVELDRRCGARIPPEPVDPDQYALDL